MASTTEHNLFESIGKTKSKYIVRMLRMVSIDFGLLRLTTREIILREK